MVVTREERRMKNRNRKIIEKMPLLADIAKITLEEAKQEIAQIDRSCAIQSKKMQTFDENTTMRRIVLQEFCEKNYPIETSEIIKKSAWYPNGNKDLYLECSLFNLVRLKGNGYKFCPGTYEESPESFKNLHKEQYCILCWHGTKAQEKQKQIQYTFFS